MTNLERTLRYQRSAKGKINNRRKRLKHRYGITEEQYAWMLAEQGGVCILCGNEETVTHHATDKLMQLAVEHSHMCDQGHDPRKACIHCIRGLACYNCNVFMGRVERSPRLAARFTDYLVRRPLAPI